MLRSDKIDSNLKLKITTIGIVIFASIVIRLYYFGFDIPVTLDGLDYLIFAKQISDNGFPTNYSLDNNGWSIFLSMIFTIFPAGGVTEYSQLQKFTSLILSSITVIPIYFLIRKFFEYKYTLIGIIFFAFEPRLIQNSILGITEPLYILLLTITLALFLSNEKKFIYLSMATAALTTLVRSEGLFLFIALSIVYFIRFRNDKLVIPKYLPALAIFVLLLLPMMLYQTDTRGEDRIVSRVGVGANTAMDSFYDFSLRGIENYVKFFVWDLIPVFILFVPIGFLLLLRKIDFRKYTILVYSAIMSLPALFAYAVPALDTRYLFFLFPAFCIMSIFTIQKITEKRKNKNSVLFVIIAAIVISSIIFLEYKKTDYVLENESINIAEYVVKNTNGVNNYFPHSKYVKTIETLEKWPNVELPFSYKTALVSEQGFDSVDEFIKQSRNQKLSHLVVDENTNRAEFLQDVFKNEEKYEYLEKKIDTQDTNSKYNVKIFEINYEKFDQIKQN